MPPKGSVRLQHFHPREFERRTSWTNKAIKLSRGGRTQGRGKKDQEGA